MGNVELKLKELLRLRLNVSVDKDVKTRNLFVLLRLMDAFVNKSLLWWP